MTYQETTWNAGDGQRLQAYVWRPEGPARAVVGLVHGLGEHAGRYSHVASLLARAGWATLAFDLRGHGRTPGPRGHASSYEAIMDDIDQLLWEAVRAFPGAPRFLYGHSLGGSLVLNHALRRLAGPESGRAGLESDRAKLNAGPTSGTTGDARTGDARTGDAPTGDAPVAGVVATSPGLLPCRPIPLARLASARMLARFWPSFPLANGLDLAGISRDPEVVRRYKADPLVHDRVSARFGLDSIEAGRWAIAHADAFRLPLLLVHGTADRVTAIDGTRRFAARVSADCTLREWPGLYHETHNEPEWREVVGETIAWMEARLPSRMRTPSP